MATFILVHGTFARAANWPALQHGLTLAADAAGEHSRFYELPWSGKNKASARQDAASEISSVVKNIQSTSRNEKIFIIGHSHGGSAIAYFLKEYLALAKTLSGCAFLSTPFVAIRPRTQAYRVAYALFFFPIFTFYALWHYQLKYSTTGFSVYLFGSGLFWACIGLIYSSLRKFLNSENLSVEACRRQTADLPHGNYLFLRCSGDEAAAGLSAAQFISWLNSKLAQKLELLIRPWSSPRKLIRVIYVLFVVVMVGLGSFQSFDLSGEGMIDLRAAAEHSLALLFFLFLVTVVPFLLILCSLAVFIIFLAQALTLSLFGWTELLTGFFVELSVEPLPFGSHSMVHIDWSTKAPGIEGITHSWTYAHPVAIRYVQDWVKTALQCRQT
jgi:Alpha/beta hydrolase of unknown function (DUF915)